MIMIGKSIRHIWVDHKKLGTNTKRILLWLINIKSIFSASPLKIVLRIITLISLLFGQKDFFPWWVRGVSSATETTLSL